MVSTPASRPVPRFDMHVPVMPLGLRAEGSYSRFALSNLPSGVSANTSDVGFNLNAVMTLVHLPLMKPYITAGPSYSNLKAPSGHEWRNGERRATGATTPAAVSTSALARSACASMCATERISVDGGSSTSVPMTVGFRF